MAGDQVGVTPADGGVAARLRATPWLWLPVAIVAGAVGLRLWTAVASFGNPDAPLADFGLRSTLTGLGALIVAFVTWIATRASRRLEGREPGDVEHPIRIPSGEIHVLPSALRIAWRKRSGAGVWFVVLASAPLYFVWMPHEGLAVTLLLLALGVARKRRRTEEIAWDSISHARIEGKSSFLVVHGTPPQVTLVIAKYSAGTRLAGELASRLGDRWEGAVALIPGLGYPPLPGIAAPEPTDVEADPSTLILRFFGKSRWLAAAGLLLVVGFVLMITGRVLADRRLGGAGAAVGITGALLVHVLGARGQSAWSRPSAAPGDGPNPIAAWWRNRPGWPGVKSCAVHISTDGIRVVGSEPVVWDLFIYLAALVIGLWATGGFQTSGGFWGFWMMTGCLRLVGIPRSRRVVADVRWIDVERAESVGEETTIRTRLAEPFDIVVLRSQYSARANLLIALREHLGDRLHDVASQEKKAEPPAPAPNATAADLEAAARRLRDAAKS